MKCEAELSKNSVGANGGPHSWACARLTLRLAPHQHHLNFFCEHVWGERQIFSGYSTHFLFLPQILVHILQNHLRGKVVLKDKI
jgi:hypothetical protein